MGNQRGEPREQPAGRASQRPAQNSCNWHCGTRRPQKVSIVVVVIVTEGSRGSARDTRRPTDDDDYDYTTTTTYDYDDYNDDYDDDYDDDDEYYDDSL
jgi:hypothetical protein